MPLHSLICILSGDVCFRYCVPETERETERVRETESNTMQLCVCVCVCVCGLCSSIGHLLIDWPLAVFSTYTRVYERYCAVLELLAAGERWEEASALIDEAFRRLPSSQLNDLRRYRTICRAKLGLHDGVDDGSNVVADKDEEEEVGANPTAAAAVLIALADAEPDWEKKVAARAKAADVYTGIANAELDYARALCDFARWLYVNPPSFNLHVAMISI